MNDHHGHDHDHHAPTTPAVLTPEQARIAALESRVQMLSQRCFDLENELTNADAHMRLLQAVIANNIPADDTAKEQS